MVKTLLCASGPAVRLFPYHELMCDTVSVAYDEKDMVDAEEILFCLVYFNVWGATK